MSISKIVAVVQPGTPLDVAQSEAVRLCAEHETDVEFEFNGDEWGVHWRDLRDCARKRSA